MDIHGFKHFSEFWVAMYVCSFQWSNLYMFLWVSVNCNICFIGIPLYSSTLKYTALAPTHQGNLHCRWRGWWSLYRGRAQLPPFDLFYGRCDVLDVKALILTAWGRNYFNTKSTATSHRGQDRVCQTDLSYIWFTCQLRTEEKEWTRTDLHHDSCSFCHFTHSCQQYIQHQQTTI